VAGIRQRGERFQVRIFGGIDPAAGKQLILTGSAVTEADAIAPRDGFRSQIEDHTAVRTNFPLQGVAGRVAGSSGRAEHPRELRPA